MTTFLKTHREILGNRNALDSFSNYMGNVVPDNFVHLISITRDSDCLSESNWACALKMLGGESETIVIHRIGHWACGWVDMLFVDTNDTEKLALAEEIYNKIEDYPILNEDHFSEVEEEEANRIWQDCYKPQDRIDYIRENRNQFEFRSVADLMSCVRGDYFAGYASELIH